MLTDEDQVAINAAIISHTGSGGTFAELLYLAGLNEGLERAAKEIERRFGICPESGAIRKLMND